MKGQPMTQPRNHNQPWSTDDATLVLLDDVLDNMERTEKGVRDMAIRQRLAAELGRTQYAVWMLGCALHDIITDRHAKIPCSDICEALAGHAKIDPDYFRRAAVRIRAARALAAVEAPAVEAVLT